METPLATARMLDEVVGDVLTSARSGFASSLRASRTPPWTTRFPAGPLVAFHIVSGGACRAEIVGGESVRVSGGELVFLPHGTEHVIASDPDADGPASLLCGGYWLDRATTHPLFRALPPLIRLRWCAGECVELAAVVELMHREVALGSQCSSAVMRRLIELMFIYGLRSWLPSTPPAESGWLAALRDADVGRALAAIHQAPDRAWSVARLAEVASMSRAAFARRFHAMVGTSPYAYVMARRIDRAALMLRETARPIAAVAHAVGYDSEFAFSRAFRLAKGTSPRAYRAAVAQQERE